MSVTVLTGLVMLVGLAGIVVPVLPGLVLIWLATALWAFQHPSSLAWVVLGVATALYAVGVLTQYLVPGRRMRRAGVRTSTLLLAVLLAVVGFFVIPVLGAVLGFVLGIFLVEYARTHRCRPAWTSTKVALGAVLTSVGIELLAGFAIITTWVAGLLLLGPGH